MTEYKYTYFQFDGNSSIKTEWGIQLKDIKTTVLLHTPELIIKEFEYPNGFKIKSEVAADSIVTYTNKPLIDNGDGTFSVDMDV